MGRVLIVDDDEVIGFTLARYLEKQGFTPEVAQRYEQAQALLATGSYAVVITDLQLSGTHRSQGLDLLEQVRTCSPHTKTVLLTGDVNVALEQAAREHGATLVLGKPFSLPDLSQALRDVLAP